MSDQQKPVTKKETKPSLEVYSLSGEKKEKREVEAALFSTSINESLIQQYIRVYRTNQRQGTRSTKTRGEVRGSTKKIYKQKGTGRARHGSKKAPIFVGGGITFGPLPQEFSVTMNKKQKRQAFLSALSAKCKGNAISLIEAETLGMEPKTNVMYGFLKKRSLLDTKILLILPEKAKNGLAYSSRNIPNINVTTTEELNTYAILDNAHIMMPVESLPLMYQKFIPSYEQ